MPHNFRQGQGQGGMGGRNPFTGGMFGPVGGPSEPHRIIGGYLLQALSTQGPGDGLGHLQDSDAFKRLVSHQKSAFRFGLLRAQEGGQLADVV